MEKILGSSNNINFYQAKELLEICFNSEGIYDENDKEKIIEFYKNNMGNNKLTESRLKKIIKESIESALNNYNSSIDSNVINILYNTLEELQPYCHTGEVSELCDMIQDFIDRNSYSRE